MLQYRAPLGVLGAALLALGGCGGGGGEKTVAAGDPTNGVSNQSYAVAAGPTGVVPTPADSVEEFKVNTANQGNDFNSSSGAQVQVVTKRGTNTWHGSVYEYYLDNNFSANTWENNATAPKTPVPD